MIESCSSTKGDDAIDTDCDARHLFMKQIIVFAHDLVVPVTTTFLEQRAADVRS